MISDACVYCGACEAVCPVGAVFEGEGKYEIDPRKCVECVGHFDRPQCADICPVEAPMPHPHFPRKSTGRET